MLEITQNVISFFWDQRDFSYTEVCAKGILSYVTKLLLRECLKGRKHLYLKVVPFASVMHV